MKVWIVPFSLWLLLNAMQAHSEDRLIIRPQTCVVDSAGVCQTVLKLEYQSETLRPVCFAIEPQHLSQCRYEARAIQRAEFEISTNEDLQIQVSTPDGVQVLEQASMKVARFEPRTTRKRRHFSWSF